MDSSRNSTGQGVPGTAAGKAAAGRPLAGRALARRLGAGLPILPGGVLAAGWEARRAGALAPSDYLDQTLAGRAARLLRRLRRGPCGANRPPRAGSAEEHDSAKRTGPPPRRAPPAPLPPLRPAPDGRYGRDGRPQPARSGPHASK